MAEIMEMFVGDMAVKKETLLELCEADPQDFAKIDGIAHQFKGSSANLGAIKVVQVAVEMKEFCEGKQGDQLRGSYKELVKVMDELECYFSRYIRSVGSQGKATRSAPVESGGAAVSEAAAAEGAQPQPSESGGGAAAAVASEAPMSHGAEVESAAVKDTTAQEGMRGRPPIP